MIDSTLILTAIAPVFLIIGAGFTLRRTGVLTDAADASLMRLVVTLLYPALMLDVVLGNPALRTAGNLAWPPLVGLGTVALGFAVAWAVGPLFGLRVGSGRRTFSFTNGIYNYGYIPIPIVLALFPGRETAGVLLVHNLGVEFAFWTIGLLIITGTFGKGVWRRLINPPVIALLAALSINLAGFGESIPSPAGRAIQMLAGCAIPIGLLLGGATIADLIKDKGLFERPVVPCAACALRLLVLPILFLALAKLVPESMVELRRVMAVQAAMPAGLFPLVVARHFGGDTRVAVQVIVTTTLVSVLTIPLWIQVAWWWLDLG
ncbi:MAG: AEC family transporter [Opitutales bacterium]|nr:AEC family transporter [Opitutales bacterium]